MTRIAKPENESSLLYMAHYGTAGQLCNALARDCGPRRPQAQAMEEVRLRRRRRTADGMPSRVASCEIDKDGYWVLKGRFTPEQGAVIRQALEKAMAEGAFRP
jgi:hypothetical protein